MRMCDNVCSAGQVVLLPAIAAFDVTPSADCDRAEKFALWLKHDALLFARNRLAYGANFYVMLRQFIAEF